MALIFDGMAKQRVNRTTVRDYVRGVLLEEITSGRLPIGHKLQSIHVLARQLGISAFPIREALADLEARGYIVSKHGSGTYVASNHPPLTVADAVLLCIEAKAHVFGDFGSLLMGRLLNQGFFPGIVDIGYSEFGGALLDRALASDARFFVVHGVRSFNFSLLQRTALPGRHFISVIDWETELPIPGVHKILTDYAEGGRVVARHLYANGHRNVLLLGTDSMIDDISGASEIQRRSGWGFVETWRELGGSWKTLCNDVVDGEILLNPERFFNIFEGDHVPTAIFGLFDVAAWKAQELLLNHKPDLAASVEIIGYGNTPWSQAGHPPFSTIDLDLERMADETTRVIEALRAETLSEPAGPIILPPRLIIRR